MWWACARAGGGLEVRQALGPPPPPRAAPAAAALVTYKRAKDAALCLSSEADAHLKVRPVKPDKPEQEGVEAAGEPAEAAAGSDAPLGRGGNAREAFSPVAAMIALRAETSSLLRGAAAVEAEVINMRPGQTTEAVAIASLCDQARGVLKIRRQRAGGVALKEADAAIKLQAVHRGRAGRRELFAELGLM